MVGGPAGNGVGGGVGVAVGGRSVAVGSRGEVRGESNGDSNGSPGSVASGVDVAVGLAIAVGDELGVHVTGRDGVLRTGVEGGVPSSVDAPQADSNAASMRTQMHLRTQHRSIVRILVSMPPIVVAN